MKDFETERCPDPVDAASNNEMEAVATALRNRTIEAQQSREAPDEDEQGNRFCLDCGQTIPSARVEAVAAVRCVHCASRREKQDRIGRQKGGAGRSFGEEM